MAFEITFPTRHTDAFAATGYVHAGVVLGLTEMAYAAFEEHCRWRSSADWPKAESRPFP